MSVPAAPRAVVRSWLSEPLPRDVRGPLDLLARTPGVARIAVMPDVHWSEGVCVGVVVGARDRLFPDAVGRDIGCGVAAEAYDVPADRLRDASVARLLLDDLARLVPVHRHGGDGLLHRLPDALDAEGLSDPHLRRLAERDGRVQFATIGRGNHFLELQADDEDRLWAMVHSGSRAMGHAIHAHHLRAARRARVGLAGIDAASEAGDAYRRDVAWAVAYAEESRRAMLRALSESLDRRLGGAPLAGSRISCGHNHVRRETHFGEDLWVHRKGAVSAAEGEAGIVPGSMGTVSFHTAGRGCHEAMASCAHGAGRALPRSEARRRITPRDLHREMGSVAWDARRERDLVEEAPSAYKDVGAVMRAQSDLVRVVRRLRPLLSFKGV
jgi:tRNA-splicing ligase RtcB